MKFVLFYHSIRSDWNHGNAHFLRGIASELIARGHSVHVYEPADGWSLRELTNERGPAAGEAFRSHYPQLSSTLYTPAALDIDRALDGADVVIVHEWNDPSLIARIGACGRRLHCRVLFHDTHHRSVTEPAAMDGLDLRHYDGVLAFGRTVADQYEQRGWAQQTWVWHEAADTRTFYPRVPREHAGDLVWVGNWGDGERTAELHRFLIDPVKALGLAARVYGVRYPPHALKALAAARIEYRGWIANYRAPEIFADHTCTVHVPRQAYARTLGGIPTIRMFEALACGIPLVSAPWDDTEHLFRPGVDYLIARNGSEMQRKLQAVTSDPQLAQNLKESGLETIRNRHTCAHRVAELLDIVMELDRAHDSPTPRRQAMPPALRPTLGS
ncbi:MAG: a-glycosyltransferase, Glycosyltransferase Family 4-like protein [Gammaproteobacteria bacterium]|nr:a-glycosyltransferase, Glycosyltransferase Family 4-like protein [Gammaproteobacteria bacterium]